jgi:hypothetical protein
LKWFRDEISIVVRNPLRLTKLSCRGSLNGWQFPHVGVENNNNAYFFLWVPSMNISCISYDVMKLYTICISAIICNLIFFLIYKTLYLSLFSSQKYAPMPTDPEQNISLTLPKRTITVNSPSQWQIHRQFVTSNYAMSLKSYVRVGGWRNAYMYVCVILYCSNQDCAAVIVAAQWSGHRRFHSRCEMWNQFFADEIV